jgi:hypothetical protein
MIRRILGYGFLAVVGVGVISVAGQLRRPQPQMVATAAPQVFRGDTACCASAQCAAGQCASAQCASATGTCASSCCAAEQTETAVALATDEPDCPVYALQAINVTNGTEEGSVIRLSGIANLTDLPQQPCGLTPVEDDSIEQPLQSVRNLLATKDALSPSEEQIKAAIDSYFLTTKSEAAVQILLRIVSDAPESPQAAKARAAIAVLKGGDATPSACQGARACEAAQPEAEQSRLKALEESIVHGPPSNQAEGEALRTPNVKGKYKNLLRVVSAPGDVGPYGQFHDFGFWNGTSYLGHDKLPQGYWVYVAPTWYLWGDEQKPE